MKENRPSRLRYNRITKISPAHQRYSFNSDTSTSTSTRTRIVINMHSCTGRDIIPILDRDALSLIDTVVSMAGTTTNPFVTKITNHVIDFIDTNQTRSKFKLEALR